MPMSVKGLDERYIQLREHFLLKESLLEKNNATFAARTKTSTQPIITTL
jgi:hypothetical protein